MQAMTRTSHGLTRAEERVVTEGLSVTAVLMRRLLFGLRRKATVVINWT
jgi:hypothetical protein